MKIGFEVKPFNFNLKSRRLELGYTQKELGIDTQTSAEFIGILELLKMPPGRLFAIREKMNRVAKCLEVEFSWLFPQDYLDVIQFKLVPKRKRPMVWVCDLDIAQITDDTLYALPSPETQMVEADFISDISNTLEQVLSTLSDRERQILEMRFGFGNREARTLESVGDELGTTRERIRSIEAHALRKLRHPLRSRPLREARIIEG